MRMFTCIKTFINISITLWNWNIRFFLPITIRLGCKLCVTSYSFLIRWLFLKCISNSCIGKNSNLIVQYFYGSNFDEQSFSFILWSSIRIDIISNKADSRCRIRNCPAWWFHIPVSPVAWPKVNSFPWHKTMHQWLMIVLLHPSDFGFGIFATWKRFPKISFYINHLLYSNMIAFDKNVSEIYNQTYIFYKNKLSRNLFVRL